MNTDIATEQVSQIDKTSNSFKPEDIRRWGIARFMREIAPEKPLVVPNLGFTLVENQRMDKFLTQEVLTNDF